MLTLIKMLASLRGFSTKRKCLVACTIWIAFPISISYLTIFPFGLLGASQSTAEQAFVTSSTSGTTLIEHNFTYSIYPLCILCMMCAVVPPTYCSCEFYFFYYVILGPELAEKRGSRHRLCNGVYFSCFGMIR